MISFDNKLLDDYMSKFGDMPPLVMCMGYNHPIYIKLMKKAIKNWRSPMGSASFRYNCYSIYIYISFLRIKKIREE